MEPSDWPCRAVDKFLAPSQEIWVHCGLGERVPSQSVRSLLGMRTKAITPSLADRLCSLAESQLQTQTARSASVDAGALGVLSACAAIAAIVLSIRSTAHLWIAALALLGLSASLAIRILLLTGAKEIGPLATQILDARGTCDDKELEQSLLEDLADETYTNSKALARKDPLLTWALLLLVFAIALELAGVQ